MLGQRGQHDFPIQDRLGMPVSCGFRRGGKLFESLALCGLLNRGRPLDGVERLQLELR